MDALGRRSSASQGDYSRFGRRRFRQLKNPEAGKATLTTTSARKAICDPPVAEE
jgi:hypothetical protein